MQTHETWPSQVGSLSIFVAADPRLYVGCSHHWSEYPLNFASSELQGAHLSFVCMGKTVAFGRWHRSPSGRWQSRVGGKGRDRECQPASGYTKLQGHRDGMRAMTCGEQGFSQDPRHLKLSELPLVFSFTETNTRISTSQVCSD